MQSNNNYYHYYYKNISRQQCLKTDTSPQLLKYKDTLIAHIVLAMSNSPLQNNKSYIAAKAAEHRKFCQAVAKAVKTNISCH